MKIKKILFNIYISLVIIFIISAIVLTVLGKKTRIGYFTRLNINTIETLKLNNLNNKIELNSYISTNSLKYYSYNYIATYEDKVFRHTDLYGIKFDTNSLPSYIELNIYNNDGTPYGTLISTKPLNDRVKVEYKLFIKPAIINIFSWVSIIFFLIYFFDKRQKIIDYIKSTAIYNLFKQKEHLITKKVFIISVIIIALLLFIFQFWLAYPGYFQYGDNLGTMGEAFDRNYQNWNPVIIAVFLSFLYDIFGYHTFYILFLNLFLWYSSITLIILSLYLKYNKKIVIFLFLISFLANIFFTITIIKNKIIKIIALILSAFILVIGMLWRLNFIVTVYPMFILYTYLLLGNNIKNKKIYFIKFVSIMIIVAAVLISISKIFPTLFIKDMTYSKLASNHIFLWQIAACNVPSNDSSMIPNEWYAEDNNFEDLKELYNNNKLLADPFGRSNTDAKTLFKKEYLPNLKIVWIKSILKHPINYLIHTARFSFYCIIINTWKIPHGSFQAKDSEPYPFILYYINNFDNRGVTFTPIKDKIYSFIYNASLDINTIFFVIITLIAFVLSSIFILFKHKYINSILIFTFASSFSSIATIAIVSLFAPDILYRYMHPVVPISIISLISLICFIIDIGGFNKFKFELKSIKLIGNKK